MKLDLVKILIAIFAVFLLCTTVLAPKKEGAKQMLESVQGAGKKKDATEMLESVTMARKAPPKSFAEEQYEEIGRLVYLGARSPDRVLNSTHDFAFRPMGSSRPILNYRAAVRGRILTKNRLKELFDNLDGNKAIYKEKIAAHEKLKEEGHLNYK